MRGFAAAACAVFAAACASATAPEAAQGAGGLDLVIETTAKANEGRPVRVDLVVSYDAATTRALARYDWFSVRDAILGKDGVDIDRHAFMVKPGAHIERRIAFRKTPERILVQVDMPDAGKTEQGFMGVAEGMCALDQANCSAAPAPASITVRIGRRVWTAGGR